MPTANLASAYVAFGSALLVMACGGGGGDAAVSDTGPGQSPSGPDAADGPAIQADSGPDTQQPPPPAPDSGAGRVIKWNPGHYMASDACLKNDGKDITSSGVAAEIQALSAFAGMKGYLVYASWAHVEPTKDVYDFTVLDAISAQLKSQGKRFVLHITPGPFTGGGDRPGRGDYRYLPQYLLTDSSYGPSLPAGDANGYGGYWGAATGGYFADFSNANVVSRFSALVSAIGLHYDGDPSFEAFVAVNETSNMYPEKDAGVSATEFVADIEAMASAAGAAFPHTSVIVQNTWSGTQQTTYDLAHWMYDHRVAPGSPDTMGATGFESYSLYKPDGALAWGLQAYMGIPDTGVTGVFDMRPGSRAMLEVQAGDMGVYQHLGAGNGGPYTPTDIANATNAYYQASHVFWTHFFGTEQNPFPAGVEWKSLAPAVLAIPLTHTDYPSNYP